MGEREGRRESLQDCVVDFHQTCQIQPPQARELARFPTGQRETDTDESRAAAKKAQQSNVKYSERKEERRRGDEGREGKGPEGTREKARM